MDPSPSTQTKGSILGRSSSQARAPYANTGPLGQCSWDTRAKKEQSAQDPAGARGARDYERRRYAVWGLWAGSPLRAFAHIIFSVFYLQSIQMILDEILTLAQNSHMIMMMK